MDKILFKAGTEVKKGELLFEIDPRPYRADLEMAQAELERNRVMFTLKQQEYRRLGRIKNSGIGNNTMQDFEVAKAEYQVAKVALKVAQAKVNIAQLHLEWTRVTSPINGRIGLPTADLGNLIRADETVLGTVVSLDPMYVYFNVDERTYLRYLVPQGKQKPREARTPLAIGLASEKVFPHRAVLDALDNRADPATGTVRVRGVLANPDHALLPGLSVRVRMPLGKRKVLQVTERAITGEGGTTGGEDFLWVVNDKQVVERRKVMAVSGEGGMVTIEQGLKPGEWVVVGGTRRIKPGDKVQPHRVAMPGDAAQPKLPRGN